MRKTRRGRCGGGCSPTAADASPPYPRSGNSPRSPSRDAAQTPPVAVLRSGPTLHSSTLQCRISFRAVRLAPWLRGRVPDQYRAMQADGVVGFHILVGDGRRFRLGGGVGALTVPPPSARMMR